METGTEFLRGSQKFIESWTSLTSQTGTLSSHPPRYSWNIIEPSTSLQLEHYRDIHLVTVEHYRAVHLVTVGTLSSRPPRYSWSIIEPSTSLQLEYYQDIHLVTVGTLSSRPPHYNWNIIETSTSLQLEHYQVILASLKFMHREKISYLAENSCIASSYSCIEGQFMHRELIHALRVNIHAL